MVTVPPLAWWDGRVFSATLTLPFMDDQQQAVAKTLYETMVAAHVARFGAPSVKMRHYLEGQAIELVDRLGLTREVYAQAEDSPDTVMSVPVEQKWDEARRDSQAHRTPDGRPGLIRRWREIQILRSRLLPTEKGWR